MRAKGDDLDDDDLDDGDADGHIHTHRNGHANRYPHSNRHPYSDFITVPGVCDPRYRSRYGTASVGKRAGDCHLAPG